MGTLTTAELRRRAEGLLALGNSPARIRQAFMALGASPDQIDEALAPIEVQVRRRSQADAQSIWLFGGVAGAVLIAFIGIGIWLTPSTASPEPTVGPGTPQPPTRVGTLLPVQVQAQTLLPGIPSELIPNEIPTNIPRDFMLATPAVKKGDGSSGSSRTKCPGNQIEAAATFGGDATDWTFDKPTNGWMMTRIASGVTIRVPAGMVGGYIVITTAPEMRSVDGPATIDNINFVAMSCP